MELGTSLTVQDIFVALVFSSCVVMAVACSTNLHSCVGFIHWFIFKFYYI